MQLAFDRCPLQCKPLPFLSFVVRHKQTVDSKNRLRQSDSSKYLIKNRSVHRRSVQQAKASKTAGKWQVKNEVNGLNTHIIT